MATRPNIKAFPHRVDIRKLSQGQDADGAPTYAWTTTQTNVPAMIDEEEVVGARLATDTIAAIKTEISFRSDPGLADEDQITLTRGGTTRTWTVKGVVDDHLGGRFITAKCEETRGDV